jgi:glycerol-3-phosphate dehydrogenase (NAD(P)+)
MKKICIIGSGSWGCALAIHLGNLGHEVRLWSFSEEEMNLINNKRTCKFLKDSVIPENVRCTLDYKEAIEGSDIILNVTPSKFTRDNVKKYKEFVTNQPIIICSKGFEKETLLTLDDVIRDELPNTIIGVLSGPSHAEEVSLGVPTALVIASENSELCHMVQEEFMNEGIRVYTCDDVKGVELGGALKNIIAFCAGVAAGIGLGDNSFAALITRGLKEIAELGEVLGGKRETFYGLTGLGDLVVTCLSEHSRNRRAGKLIGEGKSLEEARKEVGMVIESIDNIEVAYELGKIHNIEMPILNTVYNVLYNNLDPKKAVTDLMIRNKKAENI